MHVCINVCIVCMYVLYVCVYVLCMYVCMYLCTYYVCMYTGKFTNLNKNICEQKILSLKSYLPELC